MGFYYGNFTDEETEARKSLVSSLEELGCDQSGTRM